MPTVKSNNVIVRGYPKSLDQNSATIEIPKKRGRPSKSVLSEKVADLNSEKKVNRQKLKSAEKNLNVLRENSELFPAGKKPQLLKQKPIELPRIGRNVISDLTSNVGGVRFTENTKGYKQYFEYAGLLFLVLLGVQLFTEYSTTNEEKEMIAYEQYLNSLDSDNSSLTLEEKGNIIRPMETRGSILPY